MDNGNIRADMEIIRALSHSWRKGKGIYITEVYGIINRTKKRKNGCFLLPSLQNTSKKTHPLIMKNNLFITHFGSKLNCPLQSRGLDLIITSC